jgi:capsular polysaccharide biosynthesis protein
MKVLWVGVVASLLVAAVVAAVSLRQTPTYEASAEVLVDLQAQCSRQICPIPLAAAHPLARLAQTMVRIDSPSVAKEAIRRLDSRMSPNELLNNLTVQRASEPFIGLSYTDTSPKRAKEVVGTVSRIAAERINRKPHVQKLPVGAELRATVWDPAKLPLTPVSPKPLRNSLIALVVGLALASAWTIVAPRLGLPPAAAS